MSVVRDQQRFHKLNSMSETATLAAWIVSNRIETVPEDARHEARRAIVNYLGCALGGSRDEAVDIAIRTSQPDSIPEPPSFSLAGVARHPGQWG